MLSFFRKKTPAAAADSMAAAAASVGSSTSSAVLDGIVARMDRLDASDDRSPNVSGCAEALSSADELLQALGYSNADELKETIFDILRSIKDPEKPQTLEDLHVVYEDGVFVQTPTGDNVTVIRVEFNPTVPHCSLATLIGLCIRVKIERSVPHQLKLDIYIKKGAHSTEDDINKQINDKERIAAAMENPNLRKLVEDCIKDED